MSNSAIVFRFILAMAAGLIVSGLPVLWLLGWGESLGRIWWAFNARLPAAAFMLIASYAAYLLAGRRLSPTRALVAAAVGTAVLAEAVISPLVRGYPLGFFVETLLAGQDIWTLRQLLFSALGAAAFLSLLRHGDTTEAIPRATASRKGDVAVSFRTSHNEPMRLISGLAAVGRLPGQSSLPTDILNPGKAAPFPLDIDRTLIAAIAERRNGIRHGRAWAYSGVTGVTAVLVAAAGPGAVIFGVLAAAMMFMKFLYTDRYVIAADYSPEAFRDTSPDADRRTQNVVTYPGRDPFRNFGIVFGTWTLTVDIERPATSDLGADNDLVAPNLDLIEETILNSLCRSGMVENDARPLYFIQGKNISRHVKRPGAFPPPTTLQADTLKTLRDSEPDQSVRRYLWLPRRIWGREVTVSYFLRLEQHGGDLSLEMVGCVMPPVSDSHRWIDKVPKKSGGQFVGDAFLSLFGGAGMMIWGPLTALAQSQEAISMAFKDPVSEIRKAIEREPDHDFGAEPSLRRQVADVSALSYFQDIDRRVAESAFTGRITRAFIDALDACHVDTSELREQRTTLLNQGVIVQGGDLKAENVAAGFGARVTQGLTKQHNQAGASA